MSTINNNQAKVVSVAEATHQINQIHRTGKLTAPSKQSWIVAASLIFGFVLLGGILVNLYKPDQPSEPDTSATHTNDGQDEVTAPGTIRIRRGVPDGIEYEPDRPAVGG